MIDYILGITQTILTVAIHATLNMLTVFSIITAPVEQIDNNSVNSMAVSTTSQKVVETHKLSNNNTEINTEINKPVINNIDKKQPKQKGDSIQTRKATSVYTTKSIKKAPLIPKIKQKKQIRENLNKLARDALVNILCATKTGGLLKPITGSGVIIDKKGVILTNAHIAQYFLLKDYVHCVIRRGSPARQAYNAKILYISPAWIKDNSKNITVDNPMGTGENDFGLLLITDATRKEILLPSVFPFLTPDISSVNINKGDPVLLASYPAGFLGGVAIQKELWITTTFSNIMNILTFKNGTTDVVSLGGNIVAQKGSSGGGVVNALTGKIIGVIVTSTNAKSTSDRDLNAITLFYINNSIYNNLGFGLNSLLEGNLQLKSDAFNKTIFLTLRQILVNEIEK